MIGVKSIKSKATLIFEFPETAICDYCGKIINPKSAYIKFEKLEEGTYTLSKNVEGYPKKCCTNCFDNEYPKFREDVLNEKRQIDLDLGQN